MGIIGKLLGKKLLSPEKAGAELFAYAKVGMAPGNIDSITTDAQVSQAIASLVYLNKAAIIISCLRDEAGSGPENCRPYVVADAFERHVFLNIPAEERAQSSECIKDLIRLTKGLDESMRIADKDYLKIALPQWCTTWLGSISDDDDFISRTSLLFGWNLSIYIRGQIASLGEAVRCALHEKH